jgi:hypothetical protein
MILAALFKVDFIAIIWLTCGVFSVLNPTLVMLDSCTWKTVFKTWALFILMTFIWIWAMNAGIVSDSLQAE